MIGSLRSVACATLLLFTTLARGVDTPMPLADRIDAVLQAGVSVESVGRLYWDAVQEHGGVEELLVMLAARTDTPAAREIEAHVHWRRGDLYKSIEVLDALLEARPDDRALLLWRARLDDATGRVEKAKAGYQRALELTDDPGRQREIHLRLAMMGLLAGGEDEQDALSEFAGGDDDTDLRNRAAIVLAVQGRPQDALDLFVAEGEGTKLGRAESRRAEWAIRAGKADVAKAAAWAAVKAAELRRDRRYALTLLLESHRIDGTLPALIEKFAAEPTLTNEEREVWIDTLRELARYDEAIELFQASAGDAFSIEMRRELLEMEREAGREDRMIESYRQLVEAEPDELTWRAGLAQALLERGDQADAEAIWPEYVSSLTSGVRLLSCAQTQASLGMDTLAASTVTRMLEVADDKGVGLLFLAGIHRDRGRLVEAEATLDRLNETASANDSVRFDLAEAYEQLGRQKKAVAVMEGIRGSREAVSEDLEMRLAWLYSEIGEEDKALEHWKQLWRRVNSVPRRRYVEDRLMSVASRRGKLADIAVDLEEKLLEGTADEREAGLLVRIYTRVKDPVSATEVLGEHMRQTGQAEIEALAEKARIYFICEDFYHYEKTIVEMMDVDPEGKGEYLRQLAMSQLERGRPDEAREVLGQLRDLEVDNVSREFEAGVLTLAGMRDEAAEAYRRGIAEYPDRIESYLLLANLMRDLGNVSRAVGMFQFLAETAEQDDLFTIAIDGLLNMEADKPVIEWARRITLERLASRDDKNYLYQLLHDLAEEANDKEGQIRALENSIAVSGTRRLSVLRECMDLSSKIRGGVFYAPGRRGPTNAGNTRFYAFGRRLIGLQEAVPPQVFLDLGKAFLDDDDVRSASRTFSLARNLPDERAYRREVAGTFERAGHRKDALRVYERLLRVSPSDVSLISKVGQLHEQEGRDGIADNFYRRGMDLLIRQAPLTTLDKSGQKLERPFFWWGGNRDAYQTYSDRIMRGLLVTLPDDAATESVIAEQRKVLDEELARLDEEIAAGVEVKELKSSPRLQKRARALRRLLIAFDRVDDADAMDVALLERFPEDKTLLSSLARTRLDWGYYDSARRLAEQSGRDEEALRAVRVMLGEEYDDTATDPVAPAEALRQLVPLLVAGDRASARSLMRRVSLKDLKGAGGHLYIINGVSNFEPDANALPPQFLSQVRRLDDPDLVLRFARAWIRGMIDSNQAPGGALYVFDQCLEYLPEEHKTGFCRFVADLVLEKPAWQAKYVGLLKKVAEVLDEETGDVDELLTAIDESSLTFGWQLSAADFIEALPESIRAKATERVITKTPESQRVQALLPVPFQIKIALDAETARVVREYFAADLTAARDKGRLKYIGGNVPGGRTPCRVVENAGLALDVLDALARFMPPKDLDAVRARRSLVLRQAGRVDEAITLACEIHGSPEPARDAYYANQARTEMYKVLVPDHAEAFFDTLDREEADRGVSTSLTDRRIRLLAHLDDAVRTRQEHVLAATKHPDEEKYLRALERLDTRATRLVSALDVNRQIIAQLENKGDAKSGPSQDELIDLIVAKIVTDSGGAIAVAQIRPHYEQLAATQGLDRLIEQAKTMGISIPEKGRNTALIETQRRIARLWDRLENPLRSREYWSLVEAADRDQYEKAMKAEEAKAAVKKPADTAKPDAEPDAEPVANPEDSMTAVRDALQAGDEDEARRMLRRLWRTYPSDDDRARFYVRYGPSPIASLNWPDEEDESDDDDAGEGDEETAEEKAEKKAEARDRARGGLAAFEPPEEEEEKTPTSAWKTLADHGFGVDEMRRVVRSRTATELRGIKPVMLGLLDAERATRGDAAVRQTLMDTVQQGRAGHTSLVQLFALLNESPELIDAEDTSILNDLVRTLEPTETRLLSRLALLYATIGEMERSARLYEFCASRSQAGESRYMYWNPYAADQTVNMNTLIKEAKEHFEGEALIDVLERMFAATLATGEAMSVLAVETWSELLEPTQAIDRLRDRFEGLDDPSKGLRRKTAGHAAVLYARIGAYDEARRCLRAAMRTYRVDDLPMRMRWQHWGKLEVTATLSSKDLFQLFPAGDELDAFDDAAAWIAAAAAEINSLLDEELMKPAGAIRPLAVIALRLAELERIDEAHTVLDSLSSRLVEASRDDRLFLVDVARAAGRPDLALHWQQQLNREELLPAVRFADLVRDTAEANGRDAALALTDELLEQSLDEDLVAAAIEIAEGDIPRTERYRQFAEESAAARAQVEAMTEQLDEWKKTLEEIKERKKKKGV